MSDNEPAARGVSVTETWAALCKDCRASRAQSGTDRTRAGVKHPPAGERAGASGFSYSDDFAKRLLDRGQSRTDRCPACRKKHSQMIRAYAVAYVDVTAIGEVADPANPRGPLGGLGPLPVKHERKKFEVDLQRFQFGLRDADIVELLDGLSEGKRVAVLEAGTGTGKSTFGPFRLMYPPDRPPRADGRPLFYPTEHGPIVVTEPRIPATTGVATFVGESLCFGHEKCTRHIGPGFPVGYQKQGEKFWDDACQLIYVTDGTMINWIRDGRLARIGTVIVDEAHERSENIDLILALLRDQLPRYPHLRVIIASATIDKQFFVEYFGGEANVHHQSVPAVKGVGYGVPMFPDLAITEDLIRNGYADDGALGRFDPWPEEAPDGEDLHAHTRRLVDLAAKEEIPVEQWAEKMPAAVADQALRLLEGTGADSGDILAFLPTTDLINQACERIRRGLRGSGTKTKVYALLSSVTEADKKAALAASKPGERKVVVSSNLAETSLTVSGVRYVIDSGLICQSEWDPHLAQESLPTKPHSQSGVRQRWGRVGRDQPGWAFPLYTRSQFASMARNTPPGSTRANLEQFLIKLKAAGVDRPSDVVMPANFVSDRYEPDDEGRKVADVFSLELARAELALAANGAVDEDGHLTVLGRELERFAGSPEHAMAIMFADRLACVQEVGAALAILSSGRLIDRDGLLRFDRDWPPAWRVQAAACHRGLAAGCSDDLDLVLRVFAAWERAPDPDRWARQWWVNTGILEAARADTLELVGTLSAAMKESASRAVDIRLIRRARAVLSRALASITYSPAEAPGTWRLELKPDAPVVEFGRQQLTQPTGRLIALSRFRPQKRLGLPAPTPVIEGLVSVYAWARDGDPDPFALALRAAQALKDGTEQPLIDRLDALRTRFPIGSVVSVLAHTDASTTRGVVRLHDAPDPGYDLPDLDDADDDEDGDEDLDASAARRRGIRSGDEEVAAFTVGGRRREADVPDDEVAAAPTDVRLLEENDPGDSRDATVAVDPPVSEPTDTSEQRVGEAEVLWDRQPSEREVSALVVRYDVLDDRLAVRLLPTEAGRELRLDPPELALGTQVTVRVGAITSDHTTSFRILHIEGDPGTFYESEMAGSLDPQNRGWVLELEEGSDWPAIVVPGFGSKDPIAVTLLPTLHRQLTTFARTGGRSLADVWVPGTIVSLADIPTRRVGDREGEGDGTVDEPPPLETQAVVRLDVPSRFSAAPFRFVVESSKLTRLGRVNIGTRVELKLAYRRSKLPVPPRGAQLPRELSGEFAQAERGSGFVTSGERPMPLKTLTVLRELDLQRTSWQRAVWRCLRESFRLRTVAVRLEGVKDKKQELIEAARRLADSTEWPEAGRALDGLFEEWKAVGSAGRTDDDALWAEFSELRGRFFERRREHYEEADRKRDSARATKTQLCEEAESLRWSTDWQSTADRLRELDARWKAAGSAGRDHEEGLWTRFRAAVDFFYERRRQDTDRQREQARIVKERLCAQAEALANSTDWKGTSEALKALQAAWKDAGSAGRDVEDVLWNRFRAAIDRFFQARQRVFDQQEYERQRNLAAKEALVSRAEELLNYYDRRMARDAYRILQAEWKMIGPANREDNERLWQRLRSVGDRLYAR